MTAATHSLTSGATTATSISSSSPFAYDASSQHLHLHYDEPAATWDYALPVGNGRLGAMVYGRPSAELLQLNEDSVWYGGPQDRTPRGAAHHLPELRRLVREGRHAEAETLARRKFFASPLTSRVYEPLGQANVEFGHKDVTGYKRWLDLSTATQSTVYTTKKHGRPISVRRDVVASYTDQVVLMRVAASDPIQFSVTLNRKSEVEYETEQSFDSLSSEDGRVILHATPGGKGASPLCMVLGAAVNGGGSVESVSGGLHISASECILAIGAQTTFRCHDPEAVALDDVDAALELSWAKLHKRHVQSYAELFGRTSLRLFPDACDITTDKRLSRTADPGLSALYHNYGRYLLISSSRPGDLALPANLQGIWNPSFKPSWGCKFTLNINVQMNYWPASLANLPECAQPVVDLVERMAERGQQTAREMYACRGWCAHSYTDIWADTSPHDDWMPATIWPLGGMWLASDALEMLKYHYDLHTHMRLARVLTGAVEFLLDFLIPSADGRYLVTNPSVSPENTFIDASGAHGILCEGSAMDITLIRRALDLYIWSERELFLPRELGVRVRETLTRLPPLHISPRTGLIQEWGTTDYDEAEPGHRHVSHLVGLYPGREITKDTPELQEAARRVLARRAESGGGHTGWSRAWLINLHARLGDADGCAAHIAALLDKSTMPNMLDNHPPFQIDGNLGGAAGIVECLVQSHPEAETTVIHLLPACPAEWEGEIKGVCVIGGWSLSFAWGQGMIDGAVRAVCAESALARTAVVVFPGGERVSVSGVGEHELHASS